MGAGDVVVRPSCAHVLFPPPQAGYGRPSEMIPASGVAEAQRRRRGRGGGEVQTRRMGSGASRRQSPHDAAARRSRDERKQVARGQRHIAERRADAMSERRRPRARNASNGRGQRQIVALAPRGVGPEADPDAAQRRRGRLARGQVMLLDRSHPRGRISRGGTVPDQNRSCRRVGDAVGTRRPVWITVGSSPGPDTQ